MNKIYLSEEEMEFISSYRKANAKDKCVIVENNRTVKAAKVIGRQG